MSSSDRRPPPSSTSIPGTWQMARTDSRLTGQPVRAPSRSTTWTSVAPAATNSAAFSAGRLA